jgi:hypothetical protein
MTNTIIDLSEDAFAAQYPLRTNHLNPTAGWACGEAAGCLFETFGEELAFVRRQDPRTVWTLIDGDDGDQYLQSGFHVVNRLGYLVSTVPVPEGATIQVHLSMAHTPEPWRYNHLAIVQDARGNIIADCEIVPESEGVPAPPAQEVANARRIVAAVNACQGISIEALERGVIRELLAALIAASDWIDAQLGEPRTEIQAKVQQAIAEATT